MHNDFDDTPGSKPPSGDVVRAISIASAVFYTLYIAGGVFYTLYIGRIAPAGIPQKFQLALWISWLVVVLLAAATYSVGRVMARTAARVDQIPSPLRREPDLTHV